MNKELEEIIEAYNELKRHKKIVANIDTNYFFEFAETVLNELKRLQEENSKLERANKTYINSIQSITPVLLEDYIEKDKIREKIKTEKINISGLEVIIVEDLEELVEGK